MSFLAPLIPAAISAGASILGSKLTGGSSSGSTAAMPSSVTAGLRDFAPTGFSGGGLNASFSNGIFGVSPTAERTNLVSNLASTFGRQAGELGALRGSIAPGMSTIRQSLIGSRDARLAEIENARRASAGNLRENLQRRRVLGSSFAQDAAARTDAEFAQAADRARAEADVAIANTFLTELEGTYRLIQDQFTASRGEFQTKLTEMNLEGNLAAEMSAKVSEWMSKAAQVEAQLSTLDFQNQRELLAKSEAAQGKFFGQTLQPLYDALGKGASSLFGGSAPGGFGAGTLNASGAV